MEVHPVPKNVLTVEFKLFGSLTVKQFMRILIPCLIALALFVSPLPRLVSLPAGLALVALGVVSALAEGFTNKFYGFLKTLFVSPRYVWKKQEKIPETLRQEKVIEQKQAAKRAAADSGDPEVNLSLERLLEMRSRGQQVTGADQGGIDPTEANFQRTYMQAFADAFAKPEPPPRMSQPTPTAPKQTLAQPAVPEGAVSVPAGDGRAIQVQTLQNSQPRTDLEVTEVDQKVLPSPMTNSSNLQAEIASLQSELASLSKQAEPDQQRKQLIMARIDEIYRALQPQATAGAATPTATERPIYGVIVDKQNRPLAGARVVVMDNHLQVIDETVASTDGKFSAELPLAAGEYVIDVQAPGFKFPHFKLKLEQGKLPAYKFRSI